MLGEIDRLRSGEDLSESLIKQVSAADRALFEVALIDALNNSKCEERNRLSESLLRSGYDEHCARRVMSEELADRARAAALLDLLRPHWRRQRADQKSG